MQNRVEAKKRGMRTLRAETVEKNPTGVVSDCSDWACSHLAMTSSLIQEEVASRMRFLSPNKPTRDISICAQAKNHPHI